MMAIIAGISEWIGVFLNLQALIGFLVGIIFYKGLAMRKQYHLRRMLSLSGTSSGRCFVYIPIYIKENDEVVNLHDLQLFLNINSLLSNAGIKIETDFNGRDITFSEIQIAGPAVNKFCKRYIEYYLKDVKLLYQLTDGKSGILIGDTFYNAEESDWAVLIKIIDKSDIPAKTIHLLFGYALGGTIAAVDYFTNHYSSIYRYNKSRPYIGIFAVNGEGAKIGKIKWHDINRFLK